MEGIWRDALRGAGKAVACVALVVGSAGCGDDDEPRASGPEPVAAKDAARAFAPLVELPADERWRPMSARWFLEHARFGFAEDQGCADRLIAVGRTMPELQNERIDWIFPRGLGSGSPNYYRNPYDASCELDFEHVFYADQLTRPHDRGNRVEGLRPAEGYYLDLDDAARSGPALAEPVAIPVYVDQVDEGDSQIRVSYWMLFGFHAGPDGEGREGDWERVDVLASVDGDGYRPEAVQTVDGEQLAAASTFAFDETAWGQVRRHGGTHPIVRAAPGTHAMAVASASGGCEDCVEWRTWQSAVPATDQLWYGFGGAWGEPGATSAATGPLGPHRYYPDKSEKARERAGG